MEAVVSLAKARFAKGEIELVQRKIEGAYEYLAVKKREKRIPLVGGEPWEPKIVGGNLHSGGVIEARFQNGNDLFFRSGQNESEERQILFAALHRRLDRDNLLTVAGQSRFLGDPNSSGHTPPPRHQGL